MYRILFLQFGQLGYLLGGDNPTEQMHSHHHRTAIPTLSKPRRVH